MKTLALLLLGTALPLSAGYRIEGSIPGLADGPVRLHQAFDGVVVAETTAAGGRFVFSHEGDFLGNKVYLSGGGIGRVELYLEPGTIRIARGPDGSVAASGTPSNDAFGRYLAEIAPVERRIAELRTSWRSATDPAEKSRLAAEIDRQHREVFYPFRREFALRNNRTILAPEFLSAGIGQLKYADLRALLERLDPTAPANWYTRRLQERAEILRRTDIGQVVPDFTLPDPDGKPFTLSSLRGQYVLIDFWASWCAPCRAENKNVVRLYERYHDAGFTVVSVSIDHQRDRWLKAIAEDALPWQHVSSLAGWKCSVANNLGVAYGMSGIPYTLLIDREGKVVGHNLTGARLAAELEKLLGKSGKS